MASTQQELQQKFNDGVFKSLGELIELAETSSASKKILFDLIGLNSDRLDAQQNLIDILMSDRAEMLAKTPKPLYDHYEVDGLDLILYFFFPGEDEAVQMTVFDFIPKDYNMKVIGDSSYTLSDYYATDYIDDTMTSENLQKLLEKELNDGI